jgi:hypothetical protein
MSADVVQIILEIIIVLIGFYLAFFKSYFQQKGKNLATKEDIEHITRIVEKVKNQIQYSTHAKISLKKEEQKSIIKCYETYNNWLNLILNIYPGKITEKNIDDINRLLEELHEAYSKTNIAYSRLSLFIEDPGLFITFGNLIVETHEMQSFVNDNFQELRMRLIHKNIEIKDRSVDDLIEILPRYEEEKLKLYMALIDGRSTHYKKILPMQKIFRDSLYSKLTKLTE